MSAKLPKTRVCHLTTVHPRFDNRIFKKECVSLANAGYEVMLLVGDGKGNGIEYGVNIYDLGLFSKAFKRLFIAPLVFAFKAWKIKAAVYHFHDPELILSGLILRLLGQKVIYDIHEDYTTSIIHRSYIPVPFKKIARFLWLLFENSAAFFFHQIIAEKYYQRRFSKAMQILNYPVIKKQLSTYNHGLGNTLLYTGNVNEERGALIHSDILNFTATIDLVMIGFCTTRTWNKIKTVVAHRIEKLNIVGIDSYVGYHEIKKKYEEGSFLCGLAIFPESHHFHEKELTKFFEYMQYGIPVVCSNFPVWKKLIEHNNCGICVNPNSKDEILSAINFLQKNQTKAQEMGQYGIKAVNEQFNWEIEEAKLINFYNSISEK
jgi:glycosyltransferase involved in cell wall biosynthesis